ncbi:MAG: hypothetical protein NT154_15225 [Verrucomicrobia bacterium]|nr:hypothetical protein [Verrucomicrobiota bacterium]
MRTSGTGSPSVYQGYFTLGNNGSLTFTPGSATPPPPPPTPVLSIVRSNSVNIISFVSSNSATYKLFLTNSAGLNSQTTNWPSLPGTIVGNGSTKSFQDTTTDALRFYRVQAY